MTDAFTALSGVQEFLLTRILPAVDKSLASEVRAAVKVLAGASLEFRTLRPRLQSEWKELRTLCQQAESLLAWSKTGLVREAELPDDLQACLALRRSLDDHVATVLIALQAVADEEGVGAAAARSQLYVMYETIARHAGERLPWQSVFPVSTKKARQHVD